MKTVNLTKKKEVFDLHLTGNKKSVHKDAFFFKEIFLIRDYDRDRDRHLLHLLHLHGYDLLRHLHSNLR